MTTTRAKTLLVGAMLALVIAIAVCREPVEDKTLAIYEHARSHAELVFREFGLER